MTVQEARQQSTALRLTSRVLSSFLVWGMFFLALYLLRSFFLMIFLTFVFAYLQSHAVDKLAPYIKGRITRVVLVGLFFLSVLIGIGFYIVPHVKHQTENFVINLPSHISKLDQKIIETLNNYPQLTKSLAIDLSDPNTPTFSPTTVFLTDLFSSKEDGAGNPMKDTINTIRSLGTQLFALGSAFLLSLLFSFLIVLDLPALTRSILELEHTRLRVLYLEMGHSLYMFGSVLGRALEAQFFIACANTALTALGLNFLGLQENLAFLSLIVFLCSFIPVAGVFISSIPIGLLALQTGGVWLMFLSILVIIAVHMIEAYIVNPRIYGRHLRMNPVLVLIILTISGKLFHVWGLLLGLPLCNYIFGHAIRYQNPPNRTNI